MKLIDLHKQWMETGKLPMDGLCYSLPEKYKSKLKLFNDGFDEYDYWACPEYEWGDNRRWRTYTPTRQTIVLLICAMEGEL